MITTVEEAEKIISDNVFDYGNEQVPFEKALGRVLAEDIRADRDLPPYNRVTMDGIAVNYDSIANGISTFRIKATQAAGAEPIDIQQQNECVEIMTGAALPISADTVIKYEDLELRAGLATLTTNEIVRGQNIHYQGRDKKQDDIIASSGTFITARLIGFLASVGKTEVSVRKLPSVVILSSGDELIEVSEIPSQFQIRRSNNYTIQALLKQDGLTAKTLHLPDNLKVIEKKLKDCLDNYQVILLSGGVSMGKFDFIPQALEALGLEKLFHKVQQRPGKPFWFGKHANGALVFAFPGNPASAFVCAQRYFIPWLHKTIGLAEKSVEYAVLDQRYKFQLPLTCFLQVKLYSNEFCQLMATPFEGNGSGDFANLAEADGFLEMPIQKSEFKRGQVFRLWRF